MKMIFKCLTGSRAYGTNIETSDWDYKGVYIQTISEVLTSKYKDQYLIGKDEQYFEVKRFVELLKSANPTVLEMLYSHSMTTSSEWNILVQHASKFLTKKCIQSFGGYAVQQIKKAKGLNKKMNWEKEKTVRKNPIDFCTIVSGTSGQSKPLITYLKECGISQEFVGLSSLDKMPNCYAMFFDWSAQYGKELNRPIEPIGFRGIAFEESTDIRLSSIPKGHLCEGILYYNKDAYSIHCKEYNEYTTWLKNRNEQRYVDVAGHNQKIDGKNLMHCVRLLDIAEEIVLHKKITVKRDNAEYLLKIRLGQIDLNTLIDQCEERLKKLEKLYQDSDLPECVTDEFCDNLILKIRGL